MNFSQKCSLLSQYLKKNNNDNNNNNASFRQHLNLGFSNPKPDRHRNPNGGAGRGGGMAETKTMDLFPRQAGSVFKEEHHLLPTNSASSVNKSEPEAVSQMTIFYGGQVIVFNDFPADKAKELILFASKSLSNATSTLQFQKPIQPTTLIPTTNSTNNMVQDPARGLIEPIANDLPIMRKASLTRFLEKRKDRITARAPYAKSADTKSWLGLAAQGPAQLHHQT